MEQKNTVGPVETLIGIIMDQLSDLSKETMTALSMTGTLPVCDDHEEMPDIIKEFIDSKEGMDDLSIKNRLTAYIPYQGLSKN